MAADIGKRIERLEKVLAGGEVEEDVTIQIIEQDFSKDGANRPGEVIMIVKAGRVNGPPGKTFYRQEGESETEFINRAECG